MQLSKLKLTYTFITTRSFSLFLQIARLGEQLFLIGRNWRIVFHHSVEELKQCIKKSRFSQTHSFNQIKIVASFNPQQLWLLLNAWKVSALSLV
ncbi:Uncharacterized protein NEOC65_001057 [Neochlamydia sp. AcF65]|nr:Uncharacterized protein [Neochlamydia sp. AcF65]